MKITEFFELSFGQWRSQGSGDHLAFAYFENVSVQVWVLTHETLKFEKIASFASEVPVANSQ